jgi:hypothetical protein
MIHKKIKKTIFVIILIIIILLFTTINLSIFFHKLSFARESIQSCENLTLGQECFVETFLLEEKGICSIYQKDKLICKIKKFKN